MNHRLRVGYQSAAKSVVGVLVVPVGEAREREVLASRGPGLFLDDGSNPPARGSGLTAAVFCDTIFGRSGR